MRHDPRLGLGDCSGEEMLPVLDPDLGGVEEICGAVYYGMACDEGSLGSAEGIATSGPS